MFAIIDIDNKHYKVSPNDLIVIEKRNLPIGQKITFNNIHLVANEETTIIGKPYIENYVVESEVVEIIKNKKITIFKKRRRKNSKRKIGHRQHLTLVKILTISNNA